MVHMTAESASRAADIEAIDQLAATVEHSQQNKDPEEFLSPFHSDVIWTTAHGKVLIGLDAISEFTHKALPRQAATTRSPTRWSTCSSSAPTSGQSRSVRATSGVSATRARIAAAAARTRSNSVSTGSAASPGLLRARPPAGAQLRERSRPRLECTAPHFPSGRGPRRDTRAWSWSNGVPALAERLAQLVLGDDRPGAQAGVGRVAPPPPARRNAHLYLGHSEGVRTRRR
ncbi:SgcJ/EcaC family oxidoreductase [Streptomyces bikiniensis]|uniref:SgcJ/EcaC family oxidoreductase n=1 Tax=Streptomyces bikiniensis TaxID=1896 RepID=A0ABW8CZP2_STRBI